MSDSLPGGDLLDLEVIADLKSMGLSFYEDIVSIYHQEAQENIQRLGSALQEKSPASLFVTAHSLKGACLNLGARQMAGFCQRLEEKGKLGNLDGVEELLRYLEDCFEETLAALQKQVES